MPAGVGYKTKTGKRKANGKGKKRNSKKMRR